MEDASQVGHHVSGGILMSRPKRLEDFGSLNDVLQTGGLIKGLKDWRAY
jgi:hypothetical protein